MMDNVAPHPIQKLKTFKQLKDDFLSTMSPELVSPMTSIKLATQMYKLLVQQEHKNRHSFIQSFPEREQHTTFKTKVDQYFQILEQERDRELHRLNNFLDLQQLDAGHYFVNKTSVYLQETILLIIKPFLHRLAEQQQTFHLEIPDSIPVVKIDLKSLERILRELLTNACKFTPAGEEITVTLAWDLVSIKLPQKFQLKVTNSGVEMPVDKCSRISKGDPWKYDGTGLGLELVQKLVEHLGGVIWVESGEGQTCFTIELPVDG